MPSVLYPFSWPSSLTMVFTAPILRAEGSIPSRCFMMATLWGMVTLAPAKSLLRSSEATRAPSSSGGTDLSSYL